MGTGELAGGPQRGVSTCYFHKMPSCFPIAHQLSLEDSLLRQHLSPFPLASFLLSKTYPGLHPCCPLVPSTKVSPTWSLKFSKWCPLSPSLVLCTHHHLKLPLPKNHPAHSLPSSPWFLCLSSLLSLSTSFFFSYVHSC